MNKRYTKRDFTKFTKRNTHKRRGKDEARRELLRAVAETEVAYSGIVLKDTVDYGRRGRTSDKRRKDEMLVRGIFSGSKGGYGFVTAEEGYDRDIFIPEDKTLGAIDGDFVEVVFHTYISHSMQEKTEGRVTKIIEYGRDFIIGTLTAERYHIRRGGARVPSDVWVLVPDDGRIAIRPRITDRAGASLGDKVSVKLIRDDRGGYSPDAYVVSNFGKTDSMEANYRAILTECDIPDEFSDEEIREAQISAARELTDEGRERFQDVIFTIDGEGAKDLDDAISLRKTPHGWRLSVHIADVSVYVEEKTALDRLVMRRGTSVYFTDKVVPMLPEALSNGACSLNPGEEKYALSAIIDLDREGNITGVRVTPSIIKSRVRGVYSEVNAILSGNSTPELNKKYKSVIPSLQRMEELYQILALKAAGRGYIDMNIDEGRVILDERGEPCDVIRINRGVSERIIEQFMLTANEAVATLLLEKGIPCVFRIHEKPSEDKLSDFIDYLKVIGIGTRELEREDVDSSAFARILNTAKERGLDIPVSRTMLRSMMKAQYSEIHSPHFGLGIDNYCHFTSPIRRLSDLATHRIIHKVLIEGKRAEQYRSYAKRAAKAATDSELRALNAERRIENLYKVVYMSRYIGESFDAVITSVTPFGIFAELENTCEGLIPISEMPGLFSYNESDMSLVHTSLAYRLGDTIRVRLEEADIIRGKLRFSLVI